MTSANRPRFRAFTTACAALVAATSWIAVAPAIHAQPNPEWNRQWGLDAIGAGPAYARLQSLGLQNGGAGVLVAISDAGVDFQHRELARSATPGPLRGDRDGHGTFIAGVLAPLRGSPRAHPRFLRKERANARARSR